MANPDPTLRAVKAWPFEEAARVADRLAASGKLTALFETGYGPSGLPHIGTFGEVARTTWVRRAFTELTGVPTRLLAFSDDMDGLRKVPDNVPNQAMLAGYLGRPLTEVPDPFGTHASFGAHNNARLRAFLDAFDFDYEFASATEAYRSGSFDTALLTMAERHNAVRDVILPTLGPDRRATYSPFLPIHPRTGVVMQVPMEDVRPDDDLLVWSDPATGERYGTRITGGHAKAQWKADWALRWTALGVDYEMSGKDLIDSVKLSSRICAILGGKPPVGFTYELFLDAEGHKISKSKGNGLTINEWLRYGPRESLSQFMYQVPTRAKRLHFDIIPRAVDDYLANVEKLEASPDDTSNPAWHIHNGKVPDEGGSPVPFSMLLNLASVLGSDDPDHLMAYVGRYAIQDISGEELGPRALKHARAYAHQLLRTDIQVGSDGWPIIHRGPPMMLRRLVEHAVHYYKDFVEPQKRFRVPQPAERAALEALAEALRVRRHELEAINDPDSRAEAMQGLVYDAGRREPFLQESKNGRPGVARAWFNALYEVLLGQTDGPRFGSFIALYGIPGTLGLIDTALAREPEADAT